MNTNPLRSRLPVEEMEDLQVLPLSIDALQIDLEDERLKCFMLKGVIFALLITLVTTLVACWPYISGSV